MGGKSHLVSAILVTNLRLSRQKITADNCLFCSDTTGSSLISIFYFLARYPEHTELLFKEISTVDTSDISVLANLPLLNGFINEAMRLIPAALTMGSRITPPEGVQVDGTWIPGGVKITGPRYTVFRSKCHGPAISFPWTVPPTASFGYLFILVSAVGLQSSSGECL